MAWISLMLAGLFEMFGVVMINKLHKERNWKSLVLLVLGFGASFILLSYAMKTLPMGTAYAIWTGIGASGGAILGMLLYGESKDWKRLVFIVMVLGAAIGLNLFHKIGKVV
ncbi:DMT family transporter [Cytobacillus praedii]|uniref:Multidrug efflux SMR transporter n=1 Tax=Cytobacillus praedii TaxID=1742358 RepID=A0A4R1AUX0_9BACI|nr:multidrug efflux SMR transporter [Cytobacillus praedii]TCJ01877.1 multidrug efflux SMR transporter [Cytobacillus praedii]